MASYQHNSYSLADYILTLRVTSSKLKTYLGLTSDSIQIGGQGQYLGTVSTALKTDQWTTKADATGAWTHSKSYDQSGTVTVELNQMADAVVRFIRICEAYYSSTDVRDGFDITITKTDDTSFAINCEDCRIVKIPDQKFASESDDQSWEFTAGRIVYSM
jgi:hypothetical protein